MLSQEEDTYKVIVYVKNEASCKGARGFELVALTPDVLVRMEVCIRLTRCRCRKYGADNLSPTDVTIKPLLASYVPHPEPEEFCIVIILSPFKFVENCCQFLRRT